MAFIIIIQLIMFWRLQLSLGPETALSSVCAASQMNIVLLTSYVLLGQIAHLTGGETGNRSPLAVEIDHFVHIISVRWGGIDLHADCSADYFTSQSVAIITASKQTSHGLRSGTLMTMLFVLVIFFIVGITTSYKGKAAATVSSQFIRMRDGSFLTHSGV